MFLGCLLGPFDIKMLMCCLDDLSISQHWLLKSPTLTVEGFFDLMPNL